MPNPSAYVAATLPRSELPAGQITSSDESEEPSSDGPRTVFPLVDGLLLRIRKGINQDAHYSVSRRCGIGEQSLFYVIFAPGAVDQQHTVFEIKTFNGHNYHVDLKVPDFLEWLSFYEIIGHVATERESKTNQFTLALLSKLPGVRINMLFKCYDFYRGVSPNDGVPAGEYTVLGSDPDRAGSSLITLQSVEKPESKYVMDTRNANTANFYIPYEFFIPEKSTLESYQTTTGFFPNFMVPHNSVVLWVDRNGMKAAVAKTVYNPEKKLFSMSLIANGEKIVTVEDSEEFKFYRKISRYLRCGKLRIIGEGGTFMCAKPVGTLGFSQPVTQALQEHWDSPNSNALKMKILNSTNYKHIKSFSEFVSHLFKGAFKYVLAQTPLVCAASAQKRLIGGNLLLHSTASSSMQQPKPGEKLNTLKRATAPPSLVAQYRESPKVDKMIQIAMSDAGHCSYVEKFKGRKIVQIPEEIVGDPAMVQQYVQELYKRYSAGDIGLTAVDIEHSNYSKEETKITQATILTQ